MCCPSRCALPSSTGFATAIWCGSPSFSALILLTSSAASSYLFEMAQLCRPPAMGFPSSGSAFINLGCAGRRVRGAG